MNNLSGRLQLLDCTLRDGGFDIGGIFGREVIDGVSRSLFDAGVDALEVGALIKENNYQPSENCTKKRHIPEYDEDIFHIPSKNQLKCILTFDVDYPLNEISLMKNTTVNFVRVAIRYSEIKKSLCLCERLVENGYKVSINPSVTTRYSERELLNIIAQANGIGVYSMYIVDTYGYMTTDDVDRFFDIYNENLNGDIRIGFHGHNSINMALANSLHFLQIQSDRSILLDSSILGMGQGAGNLQTELIVPFLLKNGIGKFNYNKILEACELIEKFYGNPAWGYSVATLLSAINRTAYKYGRYLRNELKLSYAEINRLLGKLPEENRHRFSLNNVKKLIESNNPDPNSYI
jgi:4-hydroxy 2-oxovalerate aldolase